MIYLRHFLYSDIKLLRTKILPGYTDEAIFKTLEQWNSKLYKGHAFEMFAICCNATVVGTISLLDHDGNSIGIGPEVLPKFRRKGYAKAAMQQALELARLNGYIVVTAKIRKDNIASIRLHESLGFELRSETIDKKGNTLLLYTKPI